MREGLLWFDQSHHKPLPDKVSAAANYYTTKYGSRPNVAFVNPLMLAEGQDLTVDGIKVKPSRWTAVDHFWLGVDDKLPTPAAAPAPTSTPSAPSVDLSYVQEQIVNGLSRSLAGMPALAAPQPPMALLPAHTATSSTLQASDEYQKHQAHVFRIKAMLARQLRDNQSKPVRDHIHPDGQVVRVHWFVGPDKSVSPALPSVRPMAHSVNAPIPGLPTAPVQPADTPASLSPEQVKAMVSTAANKLRLPSPEERQAEQRSKLASQVEAVRQMEAERAAKPAAPSQRERGDKGWRKGSTIRVIKDAIAAWKTVHGVPPARILVPEFRAKELKGIREIWNVPVVSDESVRNQGTFRLIAAEVPRPAARVEVQPVRTSTGL